MRKRRLHALPVGAVKAPRAPAAPKMPAAPKAVSVGKPIPAATGGGISVPSQPTSYLPNQMLSKGGKVISCKLN